MNRMAVLWSMLFVLISIAVPTRATPAQGHHAATRQPDVQDADYAGLELRLGILTHDFSFADRRREHGLDANIELLFQPGWLPFGLDALPQGRLLGFAGLTTQLAGDTTDQLYGGLTYDVFPERGLLLRLAGGLALHDGDLENDTDERLEVGQRVLFYGAFELGYRFLDRHTLSVFYQHSSNGPLGGTNQGIDNLGLRYGYRFGP